VATTAVRTGDLAVGPGAAALLAVPFFEGPNGPEPGPGAAEAARLAGVNLAGLLARQGFLGRAGQVANIAVPDRTAGTAGLRQIVALGTGPAAEAGPAAVRDAAQRLAVLAGGAPAVATTLGLLGADRAESIRAAAEGFLLGAYRPPRIGYRPVAAERLPAPDTLTLLVDSLASAPRGLGETAEQDALTRGVVAGETANWVRDLVHAPAAAATPAMLAETIAARAVSHGAAARIWTRPELLQAGFGGVLGVGQASRNEPRMVEVTYAAPGGRPVGFAGKGITFDSGGLNLKRDPGELSWMRADMAGGAAAAAAVIAAARLALPVPAVAVVPLAENMPGGGALRPGDVLTHRGGRTSEVVDTDCEGRLVVADALSYLTERNPVALIDVATLTDAAGLGPALWAALGTDQPLMKAVLAAGAAAGEPGWQLPLPGAYRDLLGSMSADLRNSPAHGPDSTVMAAMFLREFAGGTPWVHIDNGSTAWLEHSAGPWPEGATGSPARALVRFLENLGAGADEPNPPLADSVDLQQGLHGQ
jgi:leucyl aminopeptidase